MRFLNKYNQAQTWLELLKVRENQKQPLTVSAPMQIAMTEAVSKPHVVFTSYDVGHNTEEASKIQQLYAELKELPWLPAFATV